MSAPRSSRSACSTTDWETAQLLGGISVAQVIRLERAGLLTPLRPLSAPNGKVYHRAVEVRCLAQADTEGGAA